MKWNQDACVVAVDVDGRQRYLLETDKLKEVLGASVLIASTVSEATRLTTDAGHRVHLLQPVSGEIRLWALADDQPALLAAAWALREWLEGRGIEHSVAYLETDRRHFEVTREPATDPYLPRPEEEYPSQVSLSWVHRELTRQISRWKADKPAADALPACSLFAPCEIQATDVANEYRAKRDGHEPRRDQRGFRAAAKHDARERSKGEFNRDTLEKPVRRELHARATSGHNQAIVERAITFTDLADQLDDAVTAGARQTDQFVAMICADGDEVGRLLRHIDWNWPGWDDGQQPWKRNHDFARALEDMGRQAYAEGVVAVTPLPSDEVLQSTKEPGITITVPLLAQLLGGDDQWTIARRNVALHFCETFAREFAQRATQGVVGMAVRVANAAKSPEEAEIVLTMSLGVAFAQAGYPASSMVGAAEYLLKSAKNLRKRREDAVACIDWHWIESSRSESVREARESGWQHEAMVDGSPAIMSLTTRPWTMLLAQRFEEARAAFESMPRRKREQLECILRQDYLPSLLQWEAWWKGLTPIERDAVLNVTKALASEGLVLDGPPPSFQSALTFSPWRTRPPVEVDRTVKKVFDTPWLDLLALSEVSKPREGGVGRDKGHVSR